MAEITKIESKLYSIPLGESLYDAQHGELKHFELLIVTVYLKDGMSGTGYTYTCGRGGNAIQAMLDYDLAPALKGQEGSEVQAINEFCEWYIHYVGRGGIASFAISALDIALWDIRYKLQANRFGIIYMGKIVLVMFTMEELTWIFPLENC